MSKMLFWWVTSLLRLKIFQKSGLEMEVPLYCSMKTFAGKNILCEKYHEYVHVISQGQNRKRSPKMVWTDPMPHPAMHELKDAHIQDTEH